MLAHTCRELKMVKSQAKTVVFSFTANSPNTQVSPRIGSRTMLALNTDLKEDPQEGQNKSQIRYAEVTHIHWKSCRGTSLVVEGHIITVILRAFDINVAFVIDQKLLYCSSLRLDYAPSVCTETLHNVHTKTIIFIHPYIDTYILVRWLLIVGQAWAVSTQLIFYLVMAHSRIVTVCLWVLGFTWNDLNTAYMVCEQSVHSCCDKQEVICRVCFNFSRIYSGSQCCTLVITQHCPSPIEATYYYCTWTFIFWEIIKSAFKIYGSLRLAPTT